MLFMYKDSLYRIKDLLDLMVDAIDIIQQRTVGIEQADDFLLSPDKMFVLDGVCMKLIFMGESLKSIDKLSDGVLFLKYSLIPWKSIMKMRDVIAHHYFKIDADVIFETIKKDLNPLREALSSIRKDVQQLSIPSERMKSL